MDRDRSPIRTIKEHFKVRRPIKKMAENNAEDSENNPRSNKRPRRLFAEEQNEGGNSQTEVSILE